MAISSSSSDDAIIGINVTPLVDVVLVLLVIFMIAAPVLYQSGVKIDLPAAVTGQKVDHVTLKFTLQKDGKVFLDRREIKRAEVPGLVKQALSLDPKADAILSADRALSHGDVVEFMDGLKGAGLKRLAVGVAGSKTI